MKPEQFIREYGVEKAREVVEGAPEGHKGYNDVIKQYTRGVWFSRDVLLSDLKRLVESVGIINQAGGYEVVKTAISNYRASGDMVTFSSLEKRLKDHESIYGEE
ncbi:hypothetical protein QWI49_12080 [Acinetobacter nosocomialis]|uniref:hypothetical protein n=1 Tax=Acinetobacter nosocomialis TaxID=106654 RepID=UPI002742411C|nr:hypothetical protein [Acinetobacter nosocomialis]MDP7775885.1 hypothetical protein [Acinetobacter nosocomialis]